jgi:hypothetical protein
LHGHHDDFGPARSTHAHPPAGRRGDGADHRRRAAEHPGTLAGLRAAHRAARPQDVRAGRRESGTYTACTPIKDDDRPAELGLATGILPGGWYLRGNLTGEPPGIFGKIGAGMAELEAAVPVDDSRPLVEFYRRYDAIELWVPVFPA